MVQVYHEGGNVATMKLRDIRLILYLFFMMLIFAGAASRWYSSHPAPVSSSCAYAQEIAGHKCVACKMCELFAPDDDLEGALIRIIEAEEKKLQLAAFKLTSKDVARALLDAHQRSVEVEIVADAGGLDTRTNQIIKLHCAGIPVYIYPDPDVVQGRYTLMHNKFLVAHKNRLAEEAIVWTGSFNFTKSATEYNRENALIIISNKIADSYAAQIEKLKSESTKLQRIDDTRCHSKIFKR